MIPAKFDYVRPGSLDEAVTALAGGGDDAKVIAGGQSLLPLLRLRLAYPELLVDVGGLAELRGVTDAGNALVIGSRTTHYQLVHDPMVAEHCGLLAQAAATVADPAVRHRGTLGGALVHADPAGDLPAVALALDATMIARGPGGEREIPAAEFFVDYLTSSLEPDEILTAVRVPKLGSGWGYRYEKFHRTAQSWATVGVAALVRRSNGSVAEARIGLTNMGPTGGRAQGKKVLTGIAVEVREPKGIGRCRIALLEDGSAASLLPFVSDHVAPAATVITDAWMGYHGLAKLGYAHQRRSQRAARARGEDPAALLPAACTASLRWPSGGC